MNDTIVAATSVSIATPVTTTIPAETGITINSNTENISAPTWFIQS